jgi:hypothetical protein
MWSAVGGLKNTFVYNSGCLSSLAKRIPTTTSLTPFISEYALYRGMCPSPRSSY